MKSLEMKCQKEFRYPGGYLKGLTLSILSLFLAFTSVQAQSSWFADGYHGGVYGHYPKWQTAFMMDRLTENPSWRLNLELEPETFDSLKVWDPGIYQRFACFVKENDRKLLEFTNPTYSQPYTYNISGESLIRQFMYGIRKLEEHFPGIQLTTYAVEEPCFTSALPQVLKGFGFKYAVLKNPGTCYGGYTAPCGQEIVRWVGPDSTTLLTVPRYACEDLMKTSTWQTTAWNNSDGYLDACRKMGIRQPIGMCYQDAGWKNGPWLGNPEKSKSRYILWSDYISQWEGTQSVQEWRISQENVLVNLMWGSQVLQRLAQQVRKSEYLLVQTEKLIALTECYRKSVNTSAVLDEAWREVLMAQHHDCWIVPYNQMGNTGHTWAWNVEHWTSYADRVCQEEINRVAVQFAPAGRNVQVFNTTGFRRKEIVTYALPEGIDARKIRIKDQFGKSLPVQVDGMDLGRILFQADVPAMGRSCYRIENGKNETIEGIKTQQLQKGKVRLETDQYRMVFDSERGGAIVAFYDKALGKEWINPADTFYFNEFRGNFYEEGGMLSSVQQPAKIRIQESGPLRAVIQIEGKIGVHPFVQTVTCRLRERRIDFCQQINWQGNLKIGEYKENGRWEDWRKSFYDDRYKLHVVFPIASENGRLFKNAPFDVCESQLENTFFNNWGEIKHNVILDWVDVYDGKQDCGMALFTDHTTSYLWGKKYPLGLTIQYSGGGLWSREYGIDRPALVRYSLLPHAGTWQKEDLTRQNTVYREPLVVKGARRCQKEISLMELQDAGMEITALYSTGKELVVRLYNQGEAGKKRLMLKIPVRRVEETDFRERKIEAPVSVREGETFEWVELEMRTHEIKTLKIEL